MSNYRRAPRRCHPIPTCFYHVRSSAAHVDQQENAQPAKDQHGAGHQQGGQNGFQGWHGNLHSQGSKEERDEKVANIFDLSCKVGNSEPPPCGDIPLNGRFTCFCGPIPHMCYLSIGKMMINHQFRGCQVRTGIQRPKFPRSIHCSLKRYKLTITGRGLCGQYGWDPSYASSAKLPLNSAL